MTALLITTLFFVCFSPPLFWQQNVKKYSPPSPCTARAEEIKPVPQGGLVRQSHQGGCSVGQDILSLWRVIASVKAQTKLASVWVMCLLFLFPQPQNDKEGKGGSFQSRHLRFSFTTWFLWSQGSNIILSQLRIWPQSVLSYKASRLG